jgi:hypothetical protein
MVAQTEDVRDGSRSVTLLIMQALVESLASTMSLSSLLDELRVRAGSFDLVDHWKQGEFHHDVVVRVRFAAGEQRVLVVATNCNGGVKEVIAFADVPDRWALWHWRCPHVADFSGELSPILARATTLHWFDPCALLADDARSELREEFRVRQKGGGWEAAPDACGVSDTASTSRSRRPS